MDERVQETEVREYTFEDDGRIPNNPMLPLLVYPQALDSSEQDSSRCKELLAENGWGGAWVDGVFSYHHYHSNAHEVLCVVSGSASIAFGGPEGETVEVEAGDVVVIPAASAVVSGRPSHRQSADCRSKSSATRVGSGGSRRLSAKSSTAG
jgi:uncharacterized protein YjlB